MVAEQFGTLEAIYPGRIDLGLGRAPGGDFQTTRALRHGLAQDGDDFPSLIEELRTYLGPERPGQVVKAVGRPGGASDRGKLSCPWCMRPCQRRRRMVLGPFCYASISPQDNRESWGEQSVGHD